MSTPSAPDIPLQAEGPARRLRDAAAAVRARLRWWGTTHALTPAQKEQVGADAGADSRLLTAGKRLIDTRHPAVRLLAGVRTRLTSYWRGLKLPYTEPGIRLLRRSDVEPFAHALEGFRDELAQAAAGLGDVYGDVKAHARARLGRLYDEGDYPREVRGLFGVEWDFPSVEPPAYLLRLSAEVYEQERQRVAARFEEAVRLAEQAFAAEFARLLSHLVERLGARKVFRDSAVENLSEFLGRFAHLNVRSNPELDALVEQAQGLVRGVAPQELRDSGALRQHVAAEMARVQALTGVGFFGRMQ